MSSRVEITAKFAKVYVKAPKADKGQILDQVVGVTGWSRDNARRRLTAAARPPGAGRQVANPPRRQRMPKYSYDTLKVLQPTDNPRAAIAAARFTVTLDLPTPPFPEATAYTRASDPG